MTLKCACGHSQAEKPTDAPIHASGMEVLHWRCDECGSPQVREKLLSFPRSSTEIHGAINRRLREQFMDRDESQDR